jgi:protocatechuate 3,4-dioxygenase beta subunit
VKGKVLILSFSLLSSGFGLAAQQASLAGTTVDAIAHKPLSGVHVRLVIRLPGVPPAVYGAISDASGHFSIASMAPGTYAVIGERAGYVYISAPTIALKDGQPLTDFKLEMTPQTIISGRVMDEYGDPVQGVPVEALPVSEDTGKAHFYTPLNSPSSTTDDHGEFRIRGAPGKYRLRADVQNLGFERVPETRGDSDSTALYVVTYFPSVASLDRATVLDAVAGREADGNEIRLVRQHTLTIRGVVNGRPDSSTPVFISQTSSSDSETGVGQAQADPDGKFALAGLQPGTYRLTAISLSAESPLRSRTTEVRLDDTDVSNVELTLIAGEQLTGTLEMQGSREKATVLLEPYGVRGLDVPQPPGGDVAKDGAFRIHDVFPGQYQVRVQPLPENSYVKELRLNGEAVNGILDLSSGVRGSTLKVKVSPDGGEISGTVQDGNGDRLVNTPASVFLVSDAPKIRGRDIFHVTPDGKYTIHGIPPGKYRLFAVEESQYELDGSGVQEAMAAKAAEIEIVEGSRVTEDLKLMKEQDANAKQ